MKRNFDITDLPEDFFDLPNAFTGGGQTLVIEAQPGTEFSRYNVNFVEPYLFDSNTGFSARISRNSFGRFEYLEDRTSIRLGLSQRYLEKRLNVGLNYRFEVVDISDVDPGAPPDAFAVEGTSRISGLGVSASYDARRYRPILGAIDGWLAPG